MAKLPIYILMAKLYGNKHFKSLQDSQAQFVDNKRIYLT